MTINYLGLEEILRLHFQVIEDYRGSHGVRDEGRLIPVVKAPRQIVFSKEQYPLLHERAAVYLRKMIGDHPFIDSNKRTAVVICGIFLTRNGSGLTAEQQELERFVLKIATNHLEISEIAAWLTKHSK